MTGGLNRGARGHADGGVRRPRRRGWWSARHWFEPCHRFERDDGASLSEKRSKHGFGVTRNRQDIKLESLILAQNERWRRA